MKGDNLNVVEITEGNKIDVALAKGVNWILDVQTKKGGFPFSSIEESSSGAWATSQAICAILSYDENLSSETTHSLDWLSGRHVDFYWGPMKEGSRLLDSSIWAFCAFERINRLQGKYNDIIEKSLNRIFESVNVDGGWGSWKGDKSRTIITSLILTYFKKFNLNNKDVKKIVASGVSFLLDAQNEDGGWGMRPGECSNAIATSHALIALANRNLSEEVITQGLTWLESEKRQYYESSRDLFKQESVWRKDGIQRWSYFSLPPLIYAFIINGKNRESYRDLKYLLDLQHSDGSWRDPNEPHLAFHTYLTVYYLAKIRKLVDRDQFGKYYEITNMIQRQEYESLLLARKNKLQRIIIEEALKIAGRGEKFVLSSGKESDYYYDLKKVLMDPTSISIIGSIIWELIKSEGVDAIGGLESGAIPIATAIAQESSDSANPVNAFYVRKEPKSHGTQRWLEGMVKKGDRVIVVDDVITTGSSVMRAIERLEENECKVYKVICLVDREESGKEKIKDIGIKFEALFNHSDFKELL